MKVKLTRGLIWNREHRKVGEVLDVNKGDFEYLTGGDRPSGFEVKGGAPVPAPALKPELDSDDKSKR